VTLSWEEPCVTRVRRHSCSISAFLNLPNHHDAFLPDPGDLGPLPSQGGCVCLPSDILPVQAVSVGSERALVRGTEYRLV
jgi:hypothetical protein